MSSIPQPTAINPYDPLQDIVATGLGTMITEFSGPMTIDQLSTIISGYLQSLFYPSGSLPADQQAQLDAVVGNVFNAAIGPDSPVYLPYSPLQRQFLDQIISFLKTSSINTLNVVENNSFEEAYAISSLTTTEQAQLYIIGAIIGGVYETLYPEILSPDAYWSPYLDSDPAVNFANLPNWMVAALRGTMIGMAQSVPVSPADAPQGTGVSVNLITALGGGVAGLFGEVLYHWVRRPEVSS